MRDHQRQKDGRPVKVTGEIVARTSRAVKLRCTITLSGNDHDLYGWVPLSMVDHISTWADKERGFEVSELTIPQWIAKEKGFDYEELP